MSLFSQFQTGFLLVLFLLGILSQPAMAANPTKNCHCFNNRVYNPSKKFSSDGYILTTTTNSFLSTTFNIHKRNIVMMKMQGGVLADDLLLGLYTASLAAEDLNVLLDQRSRGRDWKTILIQPKIAAAVKHDTILSQIVTGISIEEGAKRVTDRLLSNFFSTDQKTLTHLRQSNLNSKEITLLFTLSAKSSIDVKQLVDLILKQGLSYSEVAYNLGFQPGDMKTIIYELTTSRPNS